MKRFTLWLVAAVLLTAVSFAQNLQQMSRAHYVAGVYSAPAYATWQAVVVQGNSSTGSGVSIIVAPQGAGAQGGGMTLADGSSIPLTAIFNTNVPIALADANAETVTPSSVSIGNCPGGNVGADVVCATITGTFNNTHGPGAIVVSGDNGLQEAITDAGNQGGGMVYWQNDGGIVSLSTSGATTTVCSSCIPAGALVLGVVSRVTTTITGCSGGWELGDGTTATRFTAANGTLTAGTVSNANLQTTSGVASTTTGMLAAAAKSIVNTCVTSNASAGAVHVRAFGYVLATPNQ